VLLEPSKDFKGTISRIFDKQYRLNGDWEMAVTHLTFQENVYENVTNFPVYIFCDLVEYAHVNGKQMRFLDYFPTTAIRNELPRYVKVIKKRFNTINVDIRRHPNIVEHSSNLEIVIVLHFRKA
jgi:hypothetical protein